MFTFSNPHFGYIFEVAFVVVFARVRSLSLGPSPGQFQGERGSTPGREPWADALEFFCKKNFDRIHCVDEQLGRRKFHGNFELEVSTEFGPFIIWLEAKHFHHLESGLCGNPNLCVLWVVIYALERFSGRGFLRSAAAPTSVRIVICLAAKVFVALFFPCCESVCLSLRGPGSKS